MRVCDGRGGAVGDRSCVGEGESLMLSAESLKTFGGLEVVSVDKIRPASYNPRQVFPERLELVALSYRGSDSCCPSTSGPTARSCRVTNVTTWPRDAGAKYVPVVRSGEITAKHAKALNLLFNRRPTI